jgi:two-component system, OmpR family, copper resistance phosphate regulon response regulator CusR
MTQRLLLVEDNEDMRNSLKQFLIEDTYSVVAVGSAEEGIDAVDEKVFDIALIDINLPGKSGFHLIEYIRSEGYEYPLIAMTARDGVVDKIKGFDLGLTDYIVKPFDLLELRARIQAHTRRLPTSVVKTGSFELNNDTVEFKAYGKKIDVTQLELRILEKLMRHNHTLVKIDDLIEYAWGDAETISTPPVRIHIANIRKKIGDQQYSIIRTIPGVGYIFDDPATTEMIK